MIVLDTHVVIWAMENHRSLGARAAALIDEATFADGAYISAITFWEVSMLANKGKVEFQQGAGAWVRQVLSQPGIFLTPIEPEIALDAGQLPGDLHGDPSDRLIIATARALRCALLTADEAILEYSKGGHVSAIDAKR